MPIHIKDLKGLNRSGKIAPVIYPGNIQHKKKVLFPPFFIYQGKGIF